MSDWPPTGNLVAAVGGRQGGGKLDAIVPAAGTGSRGMGLAAPWRRMTTATPEAVPGAADHAGTATPSRALLIAFHFGTGQTGGYRWEAMARDLAAANWRVDVLMAAGSARSGHVVEDAVGVVSVPVSRPVWLPRVLRSMLSMVRSAQRVFTRPGVFGRGKRSDEAGPSSHPPRSAAASTEGRLSKLAASTIRVLEDLLWTTKAVRVGRRLGRQRAYDVVIVTSPPHTAQLAGVLLARSLRAPYVADYRDPWNFGLNLQPFAPHPVQSALGRIMEKPMLRAAAAVVCNTDRAAESVRRSYPGAAQRVVSIPNGYDAL